MEEKTLESPSDNKEIQPVNPEENQLWFSLEALNIWPPDTKSQLTGKDPDAGKKLKAKEEVAEDEMVR